MAPDGGADRVMVDVVEEADRAALGSGARLIRQPYLHARRPELLGVLASAVHLGQNHLGNPRSRDPLDRPLAEVDARAVDRQAHPGPVPNREDLQVQQDGDHHGRDHHPAGRSDDGARIRRP